VGEKEKGKETVVYSKRHSWAYLDSFSYVALLSTLGFLKYELTTKILAINKR
jgi:hypothetical protein